MFSIKLLKTFAQSLPYSVAKKHTANRGVKVALVGASGGIGQPLSLLLKQNPMISCLAMHDEQNIKGVVADLSHICTGTAVMHYEGSKELMQAVENAAIVVVTASIPQKREMSQADLLRNNGDVVSNVVKAVSVASPAALLAIVTSPVNSIVPMAAEVLRQEDAYDPKRLFGVTSLSVIRAKKFLGQYLGIDPQCVSIPVVGGNDGLTILPLVSHCHPPSTFDDGDREKLLHCIQEGGGNAPRVISMAYAAAHFVNALLRGINGEKNVIECAYVQSDVTKAEFFASPVLLGPKGIEDNLGLPDLDEKEEQDLKCIIPILNESIKAGIQYAS